MTLDEYAQAWDDMEQYISALESVCNEEQLMAAAEIVSPGCTRVPELEAALSA